MKIRNGFVSNSSSSSFILASEEGFECTEENIKKLMYGDEERIAYMYASISSSDSVLDTNVLSRWVYHAITDALETQKIFDVIDEYTNYFMETYPQYNTDHLHNDIYRIKDVDERLKAYECYWVKYNVLKRKARREVIKLIRKVKSEKNVKFVVISFSDGDEVYGCELEHSGIIQKKFDALRISHH